MISGDERDAVVSLTSSYPDHLVGHWEFSHCPRRFDVAIRRAKTKLVVIGSSRFFEFIPPGSAAGRRRV